MAVQRGNDVYLVLAGTRVNGSISQSYNEVMNLMEITTKDSASNAKEWLADQYEADGTISGLLDIAATYGFEEIRAAVIAGASVAMIYGKGVRTTGGEVHIANVILSGLSRTDDKNSPSSWSCNYKVTGLPTYATSATTVA